MTLYKIDYTGHGELLSRAAWFTLQDAEAALAVVRCTHPRAEIVAVEDGQEVN